MQDMYMGNPLGSQLPVVDGEPNKKTVWSSFETNRQINENLVYKKADNYANAFAYAISEIVIVGKATLNGNTIALSLCIPKLAITDTWTYWMNSATYNNNTRFVQASIKNAAINNLFFYEGNTLINDATFEFYYK